MSWTPGPAAGSGGAESLALTVGGLRIALYPARGPDLAPPTREPRAVDLSVQRRHTQVVAAATTVTPTTVMPGNANLDGLLRDGTAKIACHLRQENARGIIDRWRIGSTLTPEAGRVVRRLGHAIAAVDRHLRKGLHHRQRATTTLGMSIAGRPSRVPAPAPLAHDDGTSKQRTTMLSIQTTRIGGGIDSPAGEIMIGPCLRHRHGPAVEEAYLRPIA